MALNPYAHSRDCVATAEAEEWDHGKEMELGGWNTRAALEVLSLNGVEWKV